MTLKSVWGFDPEKVIRAQPLLRRALHGDESVYGDDEQRAARIPSDVHSRILELHRTFRL
jgi:hypothetical protein